MASHRILVADDHEVVRQGLRVLLEAEPGWQVCGEAVTGREAIEKVKQLKPDLVVLDIMMPDLNGLEALRQIVKAAPGTQVLVLTVHDSDEIVHRILAGGARGYLLKSDAGRDLVAAVEALSQRKSFFTPRVAERVLEGYLKGNGNHKIQEGSIAAMDDPLTQREREIIQLLAEGRSTKEVSAQLSISIHTAVTHRANIMRKLKIHSVSDLVRYAIRNNLASL
ncbi:MAG: response regulator transcription factor [Candidatus Acidiferrales bacterium]